MFGDSAVSDGVARSSLSTATILFLCTHNSARSLMAEAILNRRAFRLEGPAPLRAFSAGEHPAARPHPLTLELLEAEGFSSAFAKPQDWRIYASPTAPRIHFILQVCDRDPAPPAPSFPGAPPILRWSTPDPVAAQGSADEKRAAFAACYHLMSLRIEALLADIVTQGPLDLSDAPGLRRRVEGVGDRITR